MSKREPKKLALKTETLRNLRPVSDDDLAGIQGGGARRSVRCNPTTLNCEAA